MLSFWSVSALLAASAAALNFDVPEYSVIQYDNLGFTGHYYDVNTIDASSCTCKLSTSGTYFSGTNAPLDEPLSVHLRGPLSLHGFGFYTTSGSFDVNSTSGSGSWTRAAYYNASTQTANNVTFMGNHGAASTCLGAALSYLSSDGTSSASSATVLEKDNYIPSDTEYSIFTNTECGSSSSSGDCGVYRSGIPAFQGFNGTQKMFLFSFSMPNETNSFNSSYESYNMPAIWLLNSKIPRTAQYPLSTNCSCWESGCGEFDVFEVMNYTHPLQLYSTIHDWQGVEYIATGIETDGYIKRDLTGTMTGGVVFDSKGTATVFMTNSTSIDASVDFSSVASWVSGAGSETSETLATITADSSTATSSSKAGAAFVSFEQGSSVLAVIVGFIWLFI